MFWLAASCTLVPPILWKPALGIGSVNFAGCCSLCSCAFSAVPPARTCIHSMCICVCVFCKHPRTHELAENPGCGLLVRHDNSCQSLQVALRAQRRAAHNIYNMRRVEREKITLQYLLAEAPPPPRPEFPTAGPLALNSESPKALETASSPITCAVDRFYDKQYVAMLRSDVPCVM